MDKSLKKLNYIKELVIDEAMVPIVVLAMAISPPKIIIPRPINQAIPFI